MAIPNAPTSRPAEKDLPHRTMGQKGAPVPMVAVPARRRFTLDEYLRMGEMGILSEDDRVELIDGEIIEMSPIGDQHVEAVKRCTIAFAGLMVAGRAQVSVQNPLRVDEYNDPEPDLTLVEITSRGAPRPADVLLLIEVADSSLEHDRRRKLPLYARAGVPETWLLDLQGEALEVHREPRSDGYALVRRCRSGERVSPLLLPDITIAVEDLLPPAE